MKRSDAGFEGAFDTYADDFICVQMTHDASRAMNHLTLVESTFVARSARIDPRAAMRFAITANACETRYAGRSNVPKDFLRPCE
jgi:hypothetical protein